MIVSPNALHWTHELLFAQFNHPRCRSWGVMYLSSATPIVLDSHDCSDESARSYRERKHGGYIETIVYAQKDVSLVEGRHVETLVWVL
jgi:hypothetical protein